ncbi:cytochrome P450 71A1-like [Rhododendron vialii]|uniref:cytochrome P450 71A1-like n=1 Tax=Rhododendron vialii TaxID=182163 RepID=UPI00265D8B2C|nr:cytochrome P450 71A1-like [Rhododendron vialii]
MALTPLLQQWCQELNETISISSFLFSSLLLILLLIALNFFKGSKKLNLPPSPPRLPVIGHMHLLGTLPYKSLHTLSQTYGSLLLVYLGRAPTLVVASAEMAKEIMKTQDVTFANRFQTRAGKSIMYGCRDLAFSPRGEYWRQMRKICVTQLLSLNRVHSFHSLREEEVMEWIEKIRHASLDSAPLNLGHLFVHLSSNIISRRTLGRKYEGQDNIRRFGELARSALNHFGEFCFRYIFPSLGWMDVLTGFVKRLKDTSEGLDAFLDEIIEAHRSYKENYDQPDKNCFIEILLQLQNEGMMGIDITHDSIKAILLDMLLAGTDSISSIMEWAMAELMKNPTTMQKAQEEVRTVVGMKSRIDQDDMDQMDYLKCVVKETLRLHPPAPLLIPRELTTSAKLGGYDIPPRTRVLINAWAIQRDPDLWDRPEEFLPDRVHPIWCREKGLPGNLVICQVVSRRTWT